MLIISSCVQHVSTTGILQQSSFHQQLSRWLLLNWSIYKNVILVLKGLSHELFGLVYWLVWMHLGLNKNHFWFLNFEEAPPIWGSHFKFWCVSVQTFSEILRISKKDWQLRNSVANPSLRTGDLVANPSPRTGNSVANHSRRFYDSPRNIYTLSSVSWRTANQKSTKIENHRPSCQSFSEVLRILENVWPETLQNLK